MVLDCLPTADNEEVLLLGCNCVISEVCGRDASEEVDEAGFELVVEEVVLENVADMVASLADDSLELYFSVEVVCKVEPLDIVSTGPGEATSSEETPLLTVDEETEVTVGTCISSPDICPLLEAGVLICMEVELEMPPEEREESDCIEEDCLVFEVDKESNVDELIVLTAERDEGSVIDDSSLLVIASYDDEVDMLAVTSVVASLLDILDSTMEEEISLEDSVTTELTTDTEVPSTDSEVLETILDEVTYSDVSFESETTSVDVSTTVDVAVSVVSPEDDMSVDEFIDFEVLLFEAGTSSKLSELVNDVATVKALPEDVLSEDVTKKSDC